MKKSGDGLHILSLRHFRSEWSDDGHDYTIIFAEIEETKDWRRFRPKVGSGGVPPGDADVVEAKVVEQGDMNVNQLKYASRKIGDVRWRFRNGCLNLGERSDFGEARRTLKSSSTLCDIGQSRAG